MDETPPPPKPKREQLPPVVGAISGKALQNMAASKAAEFAQIQKMVRGTGVADAIAKMNLGATYAKQLGEAVERLNKMPTLNYNFKVPPIDPILTRPLPAIQRPEIALLKQVHAELVGLAKLISETGKQTTAVVEVTKGNLTALQAVLAELQASRRSADRSSTALIWLTVALFAAAGVAAVAVAPAFVHQLIAGWSWLRSL